jgi:alkanesulfonate monooxygenase SsuD/methylene tetrahydromethanopterin reductase-like flavin-dependent oxidoreductase (luciferase family)
MLRRNTMELATYIDPNPKHAAIQARLAEDLGFTTAWFGDLPMGFADVYSCMTLAAVNTTKIRLGTSIAAAPWRDPLTTANAIATINAIAPGRTKENKPGALHKLQLRECRG